MCHAGDSGDAVMQDTFERVIGPAAARFQPDIILVSQKHTNQAIAFGPAAVAFDCLHGVTLLCLLLF